MSSLLDSFALQPCLPRDSANQSSKQAKGCPLEIDCVHPTQGHKLTGDGGIAKVIVLALLIAR